MTKTAFQLLKIALVLLAIWLAAWGFFAWIGVETGAPLFLLVVLMRPVLYVIFWGCIVAWIARLLFLFFPAGRLRDFLWRRR